MAVVLVIVGNYRSRKSFFEVFTSGRSQLDGRADGEAAESFDQHIAVFADDVECMQEFLESRFPVCGVYL